MEYFSSTVTADNNRSVLLCTDDDSVKASENGIIPVSNPIRCMSAATEDRYDLIVVSITARSSAETDQMIELCTLLKKNRHSCACPVAVFLPSADRELIERLKEVDVDYVKIQNAGPKSARRDEYRLPSDQLNEANRIEQVLSILCPYIHYSPLKGGKNLITCKAYANWLVLGPRTLRTLCETPRHRTCSYYQSPKLRA